MNRHAYFEDLAEQDDPLAFKPEQEAMVERFRVRLGDLRGKRVFEPGCGAGPLTTLLADWVGPGGHVLALDSSARMVARCKAAVAGLTEVQVLQARAEDAILVAGSWDLVLCFRFYPHLEDADLFLRRCQSALAPGGELVVANLEGSRELNRLHARLPGVRDDAMPSGEALRCQLEARGWEVTEVIDEPQEFFLRAHPA